MKNKQVFEANLLESSEKKMEVDLVFKSQIKALSKTFQAGFSENPKVFKKILDLNYFIGGYPKEDSPAKVEVLTDEFCKALIYFKLLDNNFIIDRMKEVWNIEINLPETEHSFFPEDFEENYKQLVDENETPPTEAKEALQDLINRGKAVLGQICASNDYIKLEKSEETVDACEIEKSHFMKAVNIKTKALKKEDTKPETLKEEKEKIELAMNKLSNVLNEVK